MFFRCFILALLTLTTLPARADQPEAREVARINNCAPKKIEVYDNNPGHLGSTIYQVTCDLPKIVDSSAHAGPDALLIECDQSLCTLLRPMTLGTK